MTAIHLLADLVIVVGIVVAVGVVQLRRRGSLFVFGRRVVIRVLVLAAMYFFGYSVGFNHGGIRCNGIYVSPQARAAYPHTYSTAGCYRVPSP